MIEKEQYENFEASGTMDITNMLIAMTVIRKSDLTGQN
jgi:hypothetical protein